MRQILLACFVATLFSACTKQAPVVQTDLDTSPHNAKFISVEPGIDLEVLDWGGLGRPIVLLAGLGNSAHVFDEWAPKLATTNHVYGITRRGFGNSSKPPSGYDMPRLAQDVLKIINDLNIEKPVVIGHSMAGDELNELGTKYAERISALIYLDAAFDRTDRSRTKRYEALMGRLPIQPPQPSGGFTSYSVLRAYLGDSYSVQFPIGEVRSLYRVRSDDRLVPVNSSMQGVIMMGAQKPDYKSIPLPMLAIYAIPESKTELIPSWRDAKDPEVIRVYEEIFSTYVTQVEQARHSFESTAPNGKAKTIVGAQHHVFLSHEDDVLREVREFIETCVR